MDKKIKVFISFGILAVLVFGFWFASKTITAVTGKSILGWLIKEEKKDSNQLLTCLIDKNVKMYGAQDCGHCQNEKNLFNNSQIFLKNVYVECDSAGENSQYELCLEKGISGYPTWEVNGKLYPGERTIEQISSLTGCKFK